MHDISLDDLTISASGQKFVIPLDPPMKSFSEARVRVVEMDQESLQALHRDSVTIKEYLPPKGFDAIVFTLCLATYILLSREANVGPRSLLSEYIPKFAAFVLKIRLLVLYPMIAIHLGEAVIMARKLEKHSVPLFSTLWWTWLVSTFIEGIGNFKRCVD
jgi:hypothetical protein